MKNLTFKSLLILLFFVADITAQTNKSAQSLIWKISGNGLKDDSYILFTTTNLCKDTPLNSKILGALNKVKYVCYENGSKDPLKKAEMQKMGLLSNEKQSIKNNLSNATYAKLVDKATDVGIDEDFLNTYKPFALMGIIIKNTILECNTPSNKNYEFFVRDYANKKAIKQGELFGLPEFTGLSDLYDKAYWERCTAFLLDNPAKMLTDIENKEALYHQENFNGLKSIYNANVFINTKYLYNEIETKKMTLASSRINTIIKNQASLFLLDLNYVANSKTSLFTFLTKMGYEVTPVENNL
jgi:uncharacterized protein